MSDSPKKDGKKVSPPSAAPVKKTARTEAPGKQFRNGQPPTHKAVPPIKVKKPGTSSADKSGE